MRGAQSFGDLDTGLQHLFFGQTFLPFNQIIETSAVDQLHHEIVLTLIVDADDVRVSEASGGLCLHPEAAAVELDRPCR